MDALQVQVQAVVVQLHKKFMKQALIIFVKNLQYGKVKTRLAAKVGDDKAFEIYKTLLDHTYNVVRRLNCDKYIFYSDFIEENDIWSEDDCIKVLQTGNGLGERMLQAFSMLFVHRTSFGEKDYDRVAIIGSDCAELTLSIIENAFTKLNEVDIVIGPANDGGYYLLGMKKKNEALFQNVSWSTSSVLEQTLAVCIKEGLSFYLLPVLSDIDEEQDWIIFCKQQSTLHEK